MILEPFTPPLLFLRLFYLEGDPSFLVSLGVVSFIA